MSENELPGVKRFEYIPSEEYPESLGYMEESPDGEWERHDAIESEREAHKREVERAQEIFRWLLGYECFPNRKDGEGAYWWRKTLRVKMKDAGIPLPPDPPQEVKP